MTRKKSERIYSPREVEAAIKDVRKFYRLGCILVKRHSERAKYRDHAMAEEGASRGQSRTMTTWARLFALLYTSSQLEELFTLSRDRGVPLRKSHIIHLLQVPIAKERRRLQRTVIVDRWSTTRLGRHVTANYGRRGGGGRRQDIADDEVELLSQLEAMCETWLRFTQQVKGERLPRVISKPLNHVTRLIDDLEGFVGKAIARRRPARLGRRDARKKAEDNAHHRVIH